MTEWLESDETSIQKTLSLTYMKILRLELILIGGWPEEHFGSQLPLLARLQRTLPIQTMMVFIGCAHYLLHNYSKISFFVLGHIIIAHAMCLIMTVRTTLFSFDDYGRIVKEYTNFNLLNHKHKGEHYEKIHNLTHKVSHYFTLYQSCMAAVGIVLYNITPMYNDYKLDAFKRHRPKNVTLDHGIFFSYPYFVQDEHFYISTAINVYSAIVCGITICILDMLLCLMVFQIIGHIKTLMLDFETMTRPKGVAANLFTEADMSGLNALEIYDKEENVEVGLKLIEMVHHHRLIVSFADRISTFFGPMLALNYMFHLVSGCILLLECSNPDTKELARFGPLTYNIFGSLIQLSVIFEVVNSMSEKLMNSVYFMPWECMNVRNQRSMCFLMNRIQTPIQVTAMGCVPVGVQTMQAIIKTTLSYYAMLKSLSQPT